MADCQVADVYRCAQGVLVSFIGRIRAATAGFTDERVRLAGEAIAGSLAVKMLGTRHASLNMWQRAAQTRCACDVWQQLLGYHRGCCACCMDSTRSTFTTINLTFLPSPWTSTTSCVSCALQASVLPLRSEQIVHGCRVGGCDAGGAARDVDGV